MRDARSRTCTERPRGRITIDEGAAGRAGANLREERRGAGDAERRGSDVAATFEANGRLRLEPEALARAADRRGMKIGALERDQPRRGSDLRIVTAHHAADRAGVLVVSNHEHVGLERAIDSVERADTLPGPCAPDDERAPGQPLEVECVHRLSDLEHHVVGDVDDVADRADAGGSEAIGEPLGRGTDGNLEHLRAVARAEVGRLETHVKLLSRARGRNRHVRHLQRQTPDHRGFAGEPDMAETVRAIRSDLEVDDRKTASLDGRHFEPAQADLVGNSFRCAGHADQITQPGIDEPHSGNCSRKRRSFS